MTLIYVPLNTSHSLNHNLVSSFLTLSTPFSLLTIGLLFTIPTSPLVTFLHFLYYNPNTHLLLFLSSFRFFLFFLLFVFFFVFFVIFSFCWPSFLLPLLHLSFHTNHTTDLSAQNTASNTLRAITLSKTKRTLLKSNNQSHLWSTH